MFSQQKQLEEEEAVLDKDDAGAGVEGGSRMLRDEVTPDDIASVVASWTGDAVAVKLNVAPEKYIIYLDLCLHSLSTPTPLGPYLNYSNACIPQCPYSHTTSSIDTATRNDFGVCRCIAYLKVFLLESLWKASVRS